MTSDNPEIAIPADVLRKWQRIVDLLANIVRVPSAGVCKLEPPDYAYYRIVANSISKGNPFRMDETFSMDIGSFCETVIKNREPLLVTNAMEDDQWMAERLDGVPPPSPSRPPHRAPASMRERVTYAEMTNDE